MFVRWSYWDLKFDRKLGFVLSEADTEWVEREDRIRLNWSSIHALARRPSLGRSVSADIEKT